MESKSSRVAAAGRTSHHVSGDATPRPASMLGRNATSDTQRRSYTFRDIFLDPDPRIPLWERIKGGASLSLLPFALFCGGSPPNGAEDAGADAVGSAPDMSGDVISAKGANQGEVQCNPDSYIAKNYDECGLGVCRRIVPTTFCADGRIVPNNEACVPREPKSETDTTCDRIDDDCDGEIDEDLERPTDETCGRPGACQGVRWLVCGEFEGRYGEWLECRGWSSPPETTIDLCGDGIDNDCDGRVDEDDSWLHIGESCSVGEGVCRREGVRVCADGGRGSVCTAVLGRPTGPDNNDCNGLDDNCDGQIDEGWGNMGLGSDCSVGLGVCRMDGRWECAEDGEGRVCNAHDGVIITTEDEEGRMVSRISSGEPIGSDDNCNGLDDDCDGSVDEHVVPIPTSNTCGVGACETTSELRCGLGGVLEESECEPRMPTVCNDYNCDGIDDDCDGEADEAHWLDIVRGEEGVCGSVAITSECVDGSLAITSECIDDVIDDGIPIAAPLWDETSCPIHMFPETAWESNCDGYDEDDDGEIDEDFQPIAAVCREGENFSAGHLICTDGSLECVSDSY